MRRVTLPAQTAPMLTRQAAALAAVVLTVGSVTWQVAGNRQSVTDTAAALSAAG